MLDVVLPDSRNTWPERARVLPHSDVIVPNFNEAVLLTDLLDLVPLARRFHDAGAGKVVITCGGDSAVLQTSQGVWRGAAFEVEFGDGTRRGDAFTAAYIAGMLADQPPLHCLEQGNVLAASCMRGSEATTGIFTRTEVDAFLARRRLKVKEIDDR